MDAPRPAYREMTDPNNRDILATLTIKTIACARRSIARARFFENPEKEELVLSFILMTAGLGGRAREDLRDALMGAKTPALAVATTDPYAKVPRL